MSNINAIPDAASGIRRSMTGQIHVTNAPAHTIQALLPGRQLITPSDLASVTWNVQARTLNDLLWTSQADHTTALQVLTNLLAETPDTDTLPRTRELLDILRALTLHPDPPKGTDPRLHTLARELDRRLHSTEPAEIQGPAQHRSAPTESLLLYGYDTLSELEVRRLSCLAGPDSVIVLPSLLVTDTLITRLLQHGWHHATAEQAAEDSALEPQVMSADDPLHEARTAMTLAAECQRAHEHPPRILITARRPENYRAALTVASKERGLTLHWLNRTFAQTHTGALLALIATVLTEDWSYESVCSLLTSPAIHRLAPSAWASIRQAGANGQRQWATAALLPSELAALRTWPHQATPQEWYEALSRLPTLADLLFELHLWMAPRLPEISDQRTYGAVLKRALRRPAPSGTVPPDAVLVAPPEALPGSRADLVLALGLTEGVWPSAPDFQPPLDAHVRAALHAGGVDVRTAVTHAGQERALYRWAQLTAPRFVAFVPQIISGRRQLTSDLVVGAALIPARPHELAPTDPYQAPSSAPPVHPPIDLIDRRFSPTQLTRFGQCAFRWYAQYSLGLTQPQEPQRTLAPDTRGRLYHVTLDHVAQALKENPAADRHTLVEAGFAAAETQEGVDRLLNWTWQRIEHLRYLQDLVSSDEFLPTGHQIIHSEAEFIIDWNGLALHGTLDRLDHTPAGYEVTDYKTGKEKPRGAKGEGGRLNLDVQLPIYVAAAEAQTGVPVTRGRYLSVTKPGRRTLSTFQPDPARLTQLVHDLFTAADRGHFPVNPDPALDACTHCAYAPLCRQVKGEDDHLDEAS
ncbi:PD-(D/E)XK nuclease family protein [Deinococcus sp. 14RED07]|uniref:PD-(D/E)XK nuclease family protein n=1 Tax=Deinococcus sp. 14RED07 TaxID=2745874 RepID=UPI001E335FF1|nr:PD-(D/E)XK nuclease family protein [Deinococcus sp. 14RED07]